MLLETTSFLVTGTGFEPMSASGACLASRQGYEPNESHIVGFSNKKKVDNKANLFLSSGDRIRTDVRLRRI